MTAGTLLAGILGAVVSVPLFTHDHVVGALSVFCGTCRQCLGGRFALCADTDVKQPPGQAKRSGRSRRITSSRVAMCAPFAIR